MSQRRSYMIDNNNDPEGRKFFRAYLEHKGLEVIESTDVWCRWDMKARQGNKTYIFELKYRPIMSTAFNDSIIQLDKLQALRELENETTMSFVVNLFIDCFYIVPIEDEYNIQHWMAQKTNYDKNNKVPKTLVSYPHTKKNRREYGKTI